ncbi:MAG: replicative DNA helicase [Bacteriovoracaceae bacterium]|nr:replicative DNA helicase [Bacteriovoracaceae bacterium]
MSNDKITQELPHDYTAEKAVLGSLLIDNRSFDEISDLSLKADDFYHPQYGMIFEAIRDLHVGTQPFDLVTVSSKLNDMGKLERVGGQSALVALAEDVPSAANIGAYAKSVKQKAVLREVVRAASRVVQAGTNFTGDVDDFLGEVESSFFKLTNQAKKNSMRSLKESLHESLKDLERSNRAKGEITGMPTGFPSIDRKLLGLQPGQLIVIAARPGVGKTSLVLNWAVNGCKQSGLPVAIYSMEMLTNELGLRILSSEANIDSRKIRTKDFGPHDMKNMFSAVQQLSRLPIVINDSGATTLIDIRSQCRRLKAEQGLGMIIIDYLQLMQPHIRKPSREQEISEISRGLKELAKELGCPIIALSQLNRSSESRTDKRPQLSDLRESGAIEQDADIVCLIHRPDMGDPNSSKKGIATVIVAKNRAGEPGDVDLAWIASQTKFAELDFQRPEA